MDIRSVAGDVLRRRWVRRALAVGAALGVLFVGLVAVGTSGGVIVRDGDGCPRSVGALGSVSWVDVLHVGGATYERVDVAAPHGSAVGPTQVEQQIGTVRCAIGEAVQRPGYDLRDGEATFLVPGTAVHALDGTDVDYRVVAIEGGRPVVYEHRPRNATTGADLLPFAAEDVSAVTFLSEHDGRTVLGELTEPRTIRDFVEQLQAAHVTARPDLGEEARVFVAFEFDGQPPMTLVAYPGHAVTTDGLRIPEAVLEQLPDPSTGAS